jgi:acyl carrier protein
MTKEEFVRELHDVLEWPNEPFGETTTLKGHEKWDSVGVLSTMTFIDSELHVTLPAKALTEVTTVGDLVRLVAQKLR